MLHVAVCAMMIAIARWLHEKNHRRVFTLVCVLVFRADRAARFQKEKEDREVKQEAKHEIAQAQQDSSKAVGR